MNELNLPMDNPGYTAPNIQSGRGLEKLLQLINDIENVEDFVKSCTVDYKIDQQSANEILRLIKKAKENALT